MVKYETEDDQLNAVSFAAGTAACIACIERAVVVFVHWRVWAFLALNLLLLAILFTSKSPKSSSNAINREEDGANYSKFKKEKNKKIKQECSHLLVSTDGGRNPVGNETKIADDEYETKNKEEEEEEDGVKKEDYDQLSEEELNERVEAFITMFRQQYLVSDVKVNKSCGLHCIAKNVSMTSNQVNSSQRLSLT
ncbi:hypothetical protein ACP275_08G018000 [Erythranthe tilingii]